MLKTSYQPKEIESRVYEAWEKSGCFEPDTTSQATPYTIMFPPPNVTGRLHMGHALTFTLQDVLIRYHRMKGHDTLWQSGSDHAGIATQMVVERQLQSEGLDRREMGRDAFLERVWKWKEESGNLIQGQLRRLGASAAWSRDRFTLDEGLSAAVRKVFVQLYKDGLLHRDKRLVNWDPKLNTAISDLEVEQREVNGSMWYLRYPLAEDPEQFLIIATTRPETMLGDVAVAVHPEDRRYTHLIGQFVRLPIVGRLIPIIADSFADPEKGSGAVKVTPAHDFNDFQVGKRHNLPMINIFTEKASLNENVPEAYQGLDRYEARTKVIEEFDSLELFVKVEENLMAQPVGERSGVVVEPWLTDQWFVDAATLARPALEAVKMQKTRFFPQVWEKTYFDWLENIQPWCVSRQLWWGHQIPAWYGEDGTVFVEENEEAANAAAKLHYGRDDVHLQQDKDVLDTWFSSALWPFSSLGWPEKTPEFLKYYSTDVLVTGFDIIFFWVARMMMMGLYCTNRVPFHSIYIHALVRDEKGQKMSKSKGNVIDPIELIDEFGADAVRFTLATMAVQGRDIKMAASRVEGYRNFGTKLWNASRFCEMNQCFAPVSFNPLTVESVLGKWLVSETYTVIDEVTKTLDVYKFNEASLTLYQFVRGTFCDWFIELAKPLLNAEEEAQEIRHVAGWTLDNILRLLQPFMPHLTEEIWQNIQETRANQLIVEKWPQVDHSIDYQAANKEINWVISSITAVRSVRSEMNIPASVKLPLTIVGDKVVAERVNANKHIIMRLARLSNLEFSTEHVTHKTLQIVLEDKAIAFLTILDTIDFKVEKERLEGDLEKINKKIEGLNKRLSNTAFIEKAPSDVVLEVKKKLSIDMSKRESIENSVKRISSFLLQ